MQLGMQYVHSSRIGYGALGETLAQGLREQGVDLVDPVLSVDDFDSGHFPRTSSVLWVTVPSHIRGYWEGQRIICFTMWESSRLPEGFTENLDNIDLILVPNEFNQKQFSEFHPNVIKVPLGIDTKLWRSVPRKVGAFFDFLICGAGTRKGTELAYKAFQAAFTGKEDPIPRLVMKNHREHFDGPNIIRIGTKLPQDDLVNLYQQSHAYVQPSRGEGWGYQPHQALATGMPVIMSDIPGHQEFNWVGGAYNVSTTMAPSSYFIYGEAGDWWEPDFDELVAGYREIFNNYDNWLLRAQHGSAVIRDQFSAGAMASRVLDALGRQSLSEPYVGSGAWVDSKLRKFLVILNRDWRAEIAGNTYIFTKGVRYWELADVKRIMFEAGLLDPACLDAATTGEQFFAHGLTDDEIARLGEYSAKYSVCQACGHPLNEICRSCGNKVSESSST